MHRALVRPTIVGAEGDKAHKRRILRGGATFAFSKGGLGVGQDSGRRSDAEAKETVKAKKS